MAAIPEIDSLPSGACLEDPRVPANAAPAPCRQPFTVRIISQPESDDVTLELHECSHIIFYPSGCTEQPSHTDLEHRDFLEATYRFSENGHTREAVDWIIDKLDDMLNAGEFAECNAILRSADPNRLTDPLIVTFLGITLAAKDHQAMQSRWAFYCRALHTVVARRGEDGAERLLGKYR